MDNEVKAAANLGVTQTAADLIAEIDGKLDGSFNVARFFGYVSQLAQYHETVDVRDILTAFNRNLTPKLPESEKD